MDWYSSTSRVDAIRVSDGKSDFRFKAAQRRINATATDPSFNLSVTCVLAIS